MNLGKSSTKLTKYLCPSDDGRRGLHKSLNKTSSGLLVMESVGEKDILLACQSKRLIIIFGKGGEDMEACSEK